MPILFASLLTDEPCVLRNAPFLQDISTACHLLSRLGKRVRRSGEKLEILPGPRLEPFAPYEIVRKMRASVLALGPLLARLGRAKVSLPGGCAIGARPVDIHIAGLKKMGAAVSVRNGYIHARSRSLRGGEFRLRFPSVGATEQLMLAAARADAEVVLRNAAREPEIVDLARCLCQMGMKVTGAGGSVVRVSGRPAAGYDLAVSPDRIEAGTYLIAAAITGGDVTVSPVNPDHLNPLLNLLRQAGARLDVSGLRVRCVAQAGRLRPVSVKTAVYPGFPTDYQAQWMALMTQARGRSKIAETIFESRFLHVPELLRLGARIRLAGNQAIVEGPTPLSGGPVMASDLRAGAALVLAGLAARRGETTVLRVYHLDRGYEKMEKKLRKIGADIRRIS